MRLKLLFQYSFMPQVVMLAILAHGVPAMPLDVRRVSDLPGRSSR